MAFSVFIFVFLTCRLVLTVETSGGFPGLQSTTCGHITKWSTWINRHTPDISTDEVESMTTAEKSAFCGSGKLISVECETINKIPSYSAGDLSTTCNLNTGIVCITADNYPIGCQDYMIRYQCLEEVCGQPTVFTTVGTKVPGQQSTATPVGHLNEASTATPSVAPVTLCTTNTRWSAWLNRDKPSTGNGDKEEMTAEEVWQFCGNGKIVTVECATADGKSYTESGDIVDCNPSTGLFCDNFNAFPLTCQDYMIRYQCNDTVCQSAFDSEEVGCTLTCVLIIVFGVGLAICKPAIIVCVVCYKKAANAKKRMNQC